MTKRTAALAFCLAALFAASCAKPRPVPEMPSPPVEDLAQAMIERAQPITANGKLRSGGLSLGSADCQIVADPRLGVRIDAFTPFMTAAGSLVIRPERALYLNAMEGLLVRGRPEEVLGRVFGLPADPSPLAWVLTGGLPPAESWHMVSTGVDDPRGAVMLEGTDATGRRLRAAVEGPERRLTRLTVSGNDKQSNELGDIAVIECDNHMEGSLPVPRKIVFRAGERRSLVLRLDEVTIGKGPSLPDLDIPERPGMNVMDF
ncbi:MAG: hypothetical protein M5R36_10715 [Deltaproteobacteria bacterium]|nr:hypothetical protein [Deltaproteobacteria bacterium]